VFPSVENPIPETIGLGSIVSLAGSFATIGFLLATALRRSDTERNTWSGYGVVVGSCLGAIAYLVALVVELL
jgi:hypothetical protein